jgi:rhamnosyltransferase
MKIRENAYGYFHGHEVGGTNPSLLEALGCTNLNLLLDVGFNREVAEEAALYWSKESGSLARLIEYADTLLPEEMVALGCKAKQRIADAYSWQFIADQYKQLFLGKKEVNL